MKCINPNFKQVISQEVLTQVPLDSSVKRMWTLRLPASHPLFYLAAKQSPNQIYIPPRMRLISWPNTEIQITFRSAILSFPSPPWPAPPLPLPSLPSPSAGPAVSAKLPSGVSEREQLRFTNNDEACHASFSIRHGGSGGAVGRAVPVFFIKASSVWNTPLTGLFTALCSSAPRHRKSQCGRWQCSPSNSHPT